MSGPEQSKELGVFYTAPEVADYLVQWAVRSSSDLVLDPSFGEGVFLEMALKYLEKSETHTQQVYGVEFDKVAYQRTIERMGTRLNHSNLIRSDFFEVSNTFLAQQQLLESEPVLPAFDVVVGNPPFIRYHRFKGKIRKNALVKAKELGVDLNGLSSSWAPFVVYAISFLKTNGRLAMVLPAELMHAFYALPVIRYLTNSFRKCTILTFRKKLFTNLSQDTVLVLCDGKGEGPCKLMLVDLESSSSLATDLPSSQQVNVSSIINGESRLIEYLLPTRTRNLYNTLKHDDRVTALGDH
ncbi:MAG: N-6 DNA methylase [Candidatus Thorarchaeota archaeon]